MKNVLYMLIALIFCSSVSFAECYDQGDKYQSKSALRRSKKTEFGFTDECRDRMNQQKSSVVTIAGTHKNNLGFKITGELAPEEQRDLNVWQQLEQLKQKNQRQVDFPGIEWWTPIREIHQRGIMKYGSRKTWNFNVGTRDSFLAEVKPFVGFFGSRIEAAGEAGVELHGSLLGNWEGKLATARAVAFSPGTGPLSLDLQIFGPDGDLMWEKNLFRALELKFAKDIDRKIAADTIWRFAIGPVPMAAEVGALGTVGVKNSLALYPLQVSAWGKPWIAAEAYVMAGVDMWIFGTGAGGQLKLASDELLFKGSTFVEYNEEPTIKIKSSVDNDLTLLSGDIFAFVYLRIPLLNRRWMGKFTIFDWDGISFEKNLLDAAFVVKRDRTVAYGDVDTHELAMATPSADLAAQMGNVTTNLQQVSAIKERLQQQNQRLLQLIR